MKVKEIKFRPLRKIKKTGKITVASYLQWNRLKSANHSIDCMDGCLLVVDNDYKSFNQDSFVYDHKGNQLFFFEITPSELEEKIGHVSGFDYDRVPCFSHYTIDYISKHYHISRMNDFEPLKVKHVVMWFDWILYNMDNVKKG